MTINVFLEAASSWIRSHTELVWGLSILSAVTFVGTLVAVPLLLTGIPADYFLYPPREQPSGWVARHPVWRLVVKGTKNLLGVVFVVAGLAMLVLPGQGLLTMFVGMTLLDLPGKRKLEVALLRRRHVHRAINWLRRRRNRPPLQLPDE